MEEGGNVGSEPDLSIVIPAYNEEDSILPLAQKLHDVLVSFGRTFEVIFVDDGSTDGTPFRLEQILLLDRRVRVIQLAQNAGQTAALCAGIDHACGRYILAMDADMQNDPTDIPRIVQLLDEGYDVVSGWRRSRKDHICRRIPSIVANALLVYITGVKLHDFGCTLKGYRSEFIRCVPLYSDMHRFLPAFATSMGAKVTELEVKHHSRQFGQSKYGMRRIYRVMTDLLVLHMLVHFTFRPLHWFGRISVVVLLLVAGILLTERFILGGEDATMVFPAIGVLGVYLGTTLLSLGFLCELVIRVGDTEMQQLFTVLESEAPGP